MITFRVHKKSSVLHSLLTKDRLWFRFLISKFTTDRFRAKNMPISDKKTEELGETGIQTTINIYVGTYFNIAPKSCLKFCTSSFF